MRILSSMMISWPILRVSTSIGDLVLEGVTGKAVWVHAIGGPESLKFSAPGADRPIACDSP